MAGYAAFVPACGHLRFSEELSSLQERFREVGVTCDVPAQPTPLPEAWLKPETSSAMVRFVVTDYAEDRTSQQVKAMFPACRDLSIQPMSLRSIFVTLAKARRRVESTEAS